MANTVAYLTKAYMLTRFYRIETKVVSCYSPVRALRVGSNIDLKMLDHWAHCVCPSQAFPRYSYKHSSLIIKLVNYGQKKFYNIGPWS
jgi:hypothetical protein